MNDYKGREVVAGAPTSATDASDPFAYGEVIHFTTVQRSEQTLEDGEGFRIILVTETIQEGSGVTNYDPSGCWGGGGVESEYTNEYKVREQKQ